VAGVDEPLLRGFYQPALWPPGEILADRHRLALPPDLPPGRYRLDLGLYHPGQANDPLPVEGNGRFPLASLTVGEVAAPAAPNTRVDIAFENQIHLVGFNLSTTTQPAAYGLELHWRAKSLMDRNYTVFVHLIGPDGATVTQDDAPPGDPFFPTSTWLPDEIVIDQHVLTQAADAPAGEYTIVVGLYHQPTDERLQAVDAGGNMLGDAVPLATVVVSEEAP
jgi:hypothetical protein